ncbi:MAG: geranylgeranyl reductase family protein [Chloroflexota bacterium]|nr:geranylgeranyl reductase family protein [Chloroflexota bacterium]
MNSLKTDVIVIGCGPGGAQTARNLSRKGFSVALLDYRLKVGDKLCTGIVGTEMLNHYPEVSNYVLNRSRSANIHCDKDYFLTIEKNTTQALIIDREKFIRNIAIEAEDSGTILRFQRLVSNFEISDDGVEVYAKYDGDIEKYNADVLVIASGYGSKLAKRAGFGLSEHYIYGYQTKLKNVDVDKVNVFSGDPLPKGHFGWVVPTSKNKGYCGILGKEKLQNNGLEFLLDMQQKFNFDIEGKTKVWGIPISPVDKKSRNRSLLVGDVAGQVKPTTGGGIYFAMRSADVAAEVINDSLLTRDFSEEHFNSYSKKWNNIFKNELRIGFFARQFYESLNSDDIKNILNHIEESDLISKDINFDWHSKIVMMAFKTKIKSYLKGKMLRKFKSLTFN